MGINSFTYLLITSFVSTVIGFFIIYKILKKIENKSKLFAAIYFFILFSIVMFLIMFFINFKKNRISSDFYIFVHQIFLIFIDGMVASLVICLFFSIMIFILYSFQGNKNGR